MRVDDNNWRLFVVQLLSVPNRNKFVKVSWRLFRSHPECVPKAGNLAESLGDKLLSTPRLYLTPESKQNSLETNHTHLLVYT